MENKINTTMSSGFKVNYSRVQRAIKELENEKQVKEFHRSLNDLGIEVY